MEGDGKHMLPASGYAGFGVRRSATLHLASCLDLSMSLLQRYESFLINNVQTLASLESTLRSVSWLLPGRFKDAELASESREHRAHLL